VHLDLGIEIELVDLLQRRPLQLRHDVGRVLVELEAQVVVFEVES